MLEENHQKKKKLEKYSKIFQLCHEVGHTVMSQHDNSAEERHFVNLKSENSWKK